MKLRSALVMSIATVLATAAMANGESYTGSYILDVSRSHYWVGEYCLTLTDDGSLGWSHSGEALLQGNEVYLDNGTFQVINQTLMVSVETPGGTGHETLVFIASSPNDNPRNGEFEEVDGTATDTGKVKFGPKMGTC